jgi:hypothetical protein
MTSNRGEHITFLHFIDHCSLLSIGMIAFNQGAQSTINKDNLITNSAFVSLHGVASLRGSYKGCPSFSETIHIETGTERENNAKL